MLEELRERLFSSVKSQATKLLRNQLVKLLTLLTGSLAARGSIAQWLASLLPDPTAPGSIPGVTPPPQKKKKKNSAEEIVMLLWSLNGLALRNVDRTHLVLASGKPELQKSLAT